jgi:hypothetical protein
LGGRKRTSQDNESKSASKVHSRPVECKGKDKSGQQRKPNEQGTLTLCGAQKGGQIRRAKERLRTRDTYQLLGGGGRYKLVRQNKSGVTRDTHSLSSAKRGSSQDHTRGRASAYQLSSAEAGTSQDSKINPASWGHSRPAKCR